MMVSRTPGRRGAQGAWGALDSLNTEGGIFDPTVLIFEFVFQFVKVLLGFSKCFHVFLIEKFIFQLKNRF